jgi:hypothetical protein
MPTDIYEIWYGSYVTGEYSEHIIFKTIQSLIPKRQFLKVVRWNDDDAITHQEM